MKQCAECGFPARFADFFEWRGDGTIVMKQRGVLLQIALLDADELQSLFDSVSEEIGVSVDHTLVEAQRRVGKAIYAIRPIPLIDHIPHNRLTRPQWAIKAIIDRVGRDLAAIGFGVVRVQTYRAGENMSLRVENACLAPRLVGSFLGAVEVVEGVPMKADYRLDGDTLTIDVSRSDEPDTEVERFYLEQVRPAGMSLDYDRCSRCGAPLKIARMIDWDQARGRIIDRNTGHRDVMFAVQSLNALQRELEAELGASVAEIMYRAQVEISRQSPGGSPVDMRGSFWDGFFLGMALRGMGHPDSFESDEGGISVKISNAYNDTLFAARVAAACEARTGKPGELTWGDREKETVSFTVRGAA
ncbi:MAG: hypothetical protein KKF41_02425 [Actinobacteria bacterium]|nr:hypothetical protein [Actinomycetota bacterium]MBU1945125.1 hypothetical protein [Actinomycetota bacterium]MBU2686424.1 hypothetical protein [Actinomycetota bacterium]